MEHIPEEPQNLQDDIVTPIENTVEAGGWKDRSESSEPKIDHWDMVKVMRKFGFTDIDQHPLIVGDPRIKEMRDQDFMCGSETNSKGETITTIWKDGHCWARKGRHPQLDEIEKAIGHTLRRGAIQPANLGFEHIDLE